MRVGLAYCDHDVEAALRWIRLCSGWNQGEHELYLMAARGTETLSAVGWGKVVVVKDDLGARSDWSSTSEMRDASGPNSMFRQFARYFKGPWMFCEPDAIPLKEGWLDQIEAEYVKGGKPCMGVRIDIPFPHITGNAVYSGVDTEPSLMIPAKRKDGTEVAFDLAGATAMLRQTHLTKLIQHEFRARPFTSQEDFDTRVHPEAVIYHSCKDGSIYQYLTARASVPVRAGDRSTSTASAQSTLTKVGRDIDPKREAMLLRMAKARAVRSENIRLGIVPVKKHGKSAT